MKIFNKFIWSKKEPSNKNDIWFDGSTWRMYTEEAWQSFTLPVDAADTVAKVLENASEVYQEKLNAGYGIIIEDNTISLDMSSIDIDTTHNIGSIELFTQLIIDRSDYSLNEEDINAISEGKLITTTNKFNTKIPITTINHMTQADEVVGYYLVFYTDQILYRIYIDISSCSIRGGLSIKENLSNKWLSTNDYTNEEKSKLGSIEVGAQKNVIPDWKARIGKAGYIENKPIFIDYHNNYIISIHINEDSNENFEDIYDDDGYCIGIKSKPLYNYFAFDRTYGFYIKSSNYYSYEEYKTLSVEDSILNNKSITISSDNNDRYIYTLFFKEEYLEELDQNAIILYIMFNEGSYDYEDLICGEYNHFTIKTLPEFYIPDTIARQEYVKSLEARILKLENKIVNL